MAQLGKRPALDLGSGHDLTIREMGAPCWALCWQSSEPAWDSLSLSLSAPPPFTRLHALSLKINKLKKKIFRGAWVAQSVERPTWARVMISQFVSLSPA